METIQTAIMYSGIVMILLVITALIGYYGWDAFKVVRKALTTTELVIFAVIGCVCTYAAQKHISFPRTDPEQIFLYDNGSYMSWDAGGQEEGMLYVHFTVNPKVPPDSNVYISRKEKGGSGEWETFRQFTLGSMELPFIEYVTNVSNYEWAVYTDWTPGISIVTNGVWHANWGLSKNKQYIIPIKAKIIINDEPDHLASPIELSSDEDSDEYDYFADEDIYHNMYLNEEDENE